MAKFKFNLEKVLEIKEITLKQEQRRLSDIAQKRQQLLKQREHWEESMQECMSTINSLEATEAEVLASYHAYLHQIMQAVRQVEKQLYDLDAEEVKVRHRLREIQKEKTVLLNLKERKYERFLKEEERRQQAELDEIALLGGLPD